MNEITWREPRAYSRAVYRENERTNPLNSLGFTAFAFVALLALRGLAGVRPAPDAHPPAWSIVVPASMVLAVFIGYGLPRIMGYVGQAFIILSPKGVNRNTVSNRTQIRFWPWSSLAAVRFADVDLAGQKFRVVQFLGPGGELAVEIALDGKVSEAAIADYASRYGLRVAN